MLTEIGQLGETAQTKQRDCAINRGFVLYAKQQATAQQEEKISATSLYTTRRYSVWKRSCADESQS